MNIPDRPDLTYQVSDVLTIRRGEETLVLPIKIVDDERDIYLAYEDGFIITKSIGNLRFFLGSRTLKLQSSLVLDHIFDMKKGE